MTNQSKQNPTSQNKPAERKAFKEYFDRSAARQLSEQIGAVSPSFDSKKFVRLAAKNLSNLEFAGRVTQFSDAMRQCLPESVPKALDVLTQSLPPELPDCEAVTDGFLQWPSGSLFMTMAWDYFEPSMQAMIELTKRFSSEYAVRRFVQHQPEATFKRLLSLTTDSNPHVRRWCSEGVRPRLPWGVKLNDLVSDPAPIWPILDALKDDDALYVRRSVANNINDIAKDNAIDVVKRCKTWSKHSNDHRDYVIKHGLRSLIKNGNPQALVIVGIGPPKKLTAKLTVSPKQIAIGESVQLSLQCSTQSTRAQELMIDYVVHYVRKGGRSSAKVFKWTSKTLPARGQITLNKRHAMKVTTIRALYPGEHKVEVQVNGERVAQSIFKLKG